MIFKSHIVIQGAGLSLVGNLVNGVVCVNQVDVMHLKNNDAMHQSMPIPTIKVAMYLVQRSKICHFPIVVWYLSIGLNQKNQPNLVLYLVRRAKMFV